MQNRLHNQPTNQPHSTATVLYYYTTVLCTLGPCFIGKKRSLTNNGTLVCSRQRQTDRRLAHNNKNKKNFANPASTLSGIGTPSVNSLARKGHFFFLFFYFLIFFSPPSASLGGGGGESTRVPKTLAYDHPLKKRQRLLFSIVKSQEKKNVTTCTREKKKRPPYKTSHAPTCSLRQNMTTKGEKTNCTQQRALP